MIRRIASLIAAIALLGALLPSRVGAGVPVADAASKLRGDLAALVAGESTLDPRIPPLVAGYQAAELPYFVVLGEPRTAAHRSELEAIGVRVLREYASVDAFAVASSPVGVLRVAALPAVAWLAPIEMVFALGGPNSYADQTRGTPGDVGVPAWWDRGITGQGVRIAILDTGIDPTHPDLDDQDWRDWSNPLAQDAKIVEQRNFVGGQCTPVAGVQDGHGHGTHVAAIAAGTAEGVPAQTDDNGRYAGIAPDAELAIGKVLTDAGAGLNSDLVAALEWAAMPDTASPLDCTVGADIVNISLGSEARPDRLNSDSDRDLVSLTLNRLAVRYGTLFVAAAGNSGPFIGSVLEAPGSAAQALSVAAAAKDWDLNHDDTLSGDTCAGWQHPGGPATNVCGAAEGTQPASVSSFSSRGPSGDVWLRPDLAAPGYNIVSAQASTGVALAQNDLNPNTRGDALYATATGTSMAAPATAGAAALLLQAYRDRYGVDPSGASGLAGLSAPPYALLRAALMNTAGGDLYESRWILTTDAGTTFDCPDPDPLFGLCAIVELFADLAAGSLTLYEVRNGAADPYVGPLAEGAGKLNVGRAIAALRDGVVMYSAASGSGAGAGAGHRDLQGSWQVGAVTAGSSQTQDFVVHPAPGATAQWVELTYAEGNPSDGSHALPSEWVSLPGPVDLGAGSEETVTFTLSVPSGADAGTYSGVVLAHSTTGQMIRIPVLAVVALHDADPAAGNAPGPQATIGSATDIFAKDDTTWPSALGTPGTGSNADWLVYPVELAPDLSEARFSAYDAAEGGDETYDLYLYDERLDLIASTHPFAAPGVTDRVVNGDRGPSTVAAPQVLALRSPAGGRHYLVVSRARIGGTTPGDFGAFVLTLDEVRVNADPAPSQLTYEGDFVFRQGDPGRLSAVLTDADGQPIAGRTVTFTFDEPPDPCPGGNCVAVTDYRGRAQLATDAITLSAGVHEVHVTFGGDAHWESSRNSAFVIVVGDGLPPLPAGGGGVTAGGWFVPNDLGAGTQTRVHFAFNAAGAATIAEGELRYRDPSEGLDLWLVAYTSITVTDGRVTLTGSARDASGGPHEFVLVVEDRGEPGRGDDTISMAIPQDGYLASGPLGGGNIQHHDG